MRSCLWEGVEQSEHQRDLSQIVIAVVACFCADRWLGSCRRECVLYPARRHHDAGCQCHGRGDCLLVVAALTGQVLGGSVVAAVDGLTDPNAYVTGVLEDADLSASVVPVEDGYRGLVA